MQKMLCPYCDHEIKGKGKCDFCGSRVSKPVLVETTAELNVPPTAKPNECDCNLHAPKEHPHDDTYRDSEDASYQADYERAYGAGNAQGASAQGRNTRSAVSSGAGAGSRVGTGVQGAPRRAVLASEAVERGTASGTMKPASTTSQKVGKVIAIVIIVNVVLQILFMLLNL
ncbi:MAG: hypothetical protein K2P87_08830 [Lachnospiraceae bacterium]|nr:hypothetical protein [Lachnospiraceae bacterium]